uniref:Uncharacterized protein n=1 Tax=Rhizophora mucronata TaxID=61149 RepID=A0A2P2J810_RHIMU
MQYPRRLKEEKFCNTSPGFFTQLLRYTYSR